MAEGRPDYIVVEGPIGVGKTTLARRLAEAYGSDLMLEMPMENPFLDRFYRDRKNAALPTQLYFLFQRVKQIESLRQADMFRPLRVADFLMQKDRLFAEVNLSEQELFLYNELYRRISVETPVPDLVIYLQAPVEVLLKRIGERGISYEQSIDEDYLNRISKAYIDFFYHYNASPLLIVNTMDFNLSDNSTNLELLLDHISRARNGRSYFNPRDL